MSSPREREKRDSRGDEREGKGKKRKMNESEETDEIKPAARIAVSYPTVSQYQLDAPVMHTFASPNHPHKSKKQDTIFASNHVKFCW